MVYDFFITRDTDKIWSQKSPVCSRVGVVSSLSLFILLHFSHGNMPIDNVALLQRFRHCHSFANFSPSKADNKVQPKCSNSSHFFPSCISNSPLRKTLNYLFTKALPRLQTRRNSEYGLKTFGNVKCLYLRVTKSVCLSPLPTSSHYLLFLLLFSLTSVEN